MAYKSGEPSWSWRRYIIIGVILFSLYTMWDMKDAADTMVNRAIVESVFLMAMAFGLGYTGLATAQDIAAIWRTKSGLPYRPMDNGDQEPQP